MKLNNFFDKQTSTRTIRKQTPIFVSNESKEKALEREIEQLNEKVKQYEQSIIEHDEIQRISKSIKDDSKQVRFDLEQSAELISIQKANLEDMEKLEVANTGLRERVQELEGQQKTSTGIITEAQENSKKLNTEIVRIRRDNNEYKQENEEWSFRVAEAEETTRGLLANNKELDEAKRDADAERSQAVSQFTDFKKEIDLLQSDNNYWKNTAQAFEDQVNELGRVEDRLRSWTSDLGNKLSAGQSKSKKDKSMIEKLNTVVKEMSVEIEDLTDHNNYLIEFNAALKIELGKPRYVNPTSVGGQRFPLAKKNIRTSFLGTGKPTMLKFEEESK